MDYRKIGFWRLVILALLLNFVVQAIHESGHWFVCEILGRKPVWGFTQLLQIWGDQPPLHPNEWTPIVSPGGEKGWLRLASSLSTNEFIFMLAAGPFASVLGVVLGLSLLRWNHIPATKQLALILTLISSFMMSQYYLRGFSRAGGDEYFLAADLGIPKYLIDIPLGLFFIIAFISGLRALGNWRTILKWMGAIILGSIPAGLFLMKANGFILNQVDHANPFFRPLLGWSMPVVIVNILASAALWLIWKQSVRHYYNSMQTEGQQS
jgi:hypothetical protein